jgi:transposase
VIEIRINVHTQEVYEKECNCDKSVPELIVAPKPANVIYKSVFSMGTWCKMLALKYLTCVPINRFNRLFPNVGYEFSPSTILGGFKNLLEVMMPLYNEIVKYNQQESRWNADETSWCRLYDPDSDKTRLHWVWAFKGEKSVVYLIDPTRSKKVPKEHFKNTDKGIVSVDRYGAYNVLNDRLELSYCWQHLKRDFIGIDKKYPNLNEWVCFWLSKIQEIEKVNNERLCKHKQGQTYELEQQQLETKVATFFSEADCELNNEGLKKDQHKILKSMCAKKDGYTVFVRYPEVPMNNNRIEQEFRHVANARNNYNGSNSAWGAKLAAVAWTIFRSAEMNGLNPEQYLLAYFKHYATTDGALPDLDKLTPWKYKPSTETPDTQKLCDSG